MYLARMSLIATSVPVARSRARYTMAVPPRPNSRTSSYSASSAGSAGIRSVLISAGARSVGNACSTLTNLRASVRVEAQHYFAELNAVSVDQRPFGVDTRQFFVVHDYGVRF